MTDTVPILFGIYDTVPILLEFTIWTMTQIEPSRSLKMALNLEKCLTDGRDLIQKNLDKLENWTNRKLMRLSKEKCKMKHPHKDWKVVC